jgi:citrate synthase
LRQPELLLAVEALFDQERECPVMTPSDVKATLSFSDGSPSMELPIYKGTIGPDVIDIRKLYGQTGKFTYDPGFLSTASCNSTITYIDGDKGELLYRGYPIEQLAVNATSWKPATCCCTATCPTPMAEARTSRRA